jgi:Ser/Thr protein kinase RdoA (MazF antagonist)
MMQAILHHFTHRNHRYELYFLWLTDIHQSNIFVDDEGRIISLIDLEWACAVLIELQCLRISSAL